jgi:hypothetical protein
MALNFQHFNRGINLVTQTSTPANAVAGDMYFDGTNFWQCNTTGTFVTLGGGSGANLTLSNLTSPTSVNQNLIPAANETQVLGSSAIAWGPSYIQGLVAPGTSQIVIDTVNKYLETNSGVVTVAWNTGQLADSGGTASIQWYNRQLVALGGITAATWSGSGLELATALLLDGSTSGKLTQQAAATTTSYTVTWPGAQAGGSGYYLSNNGSGTLSWTAPAVAGANTALSNLAAVAINTSLLPATNNSITLGNRNFAWASGWIESLLDASNLYSIQVYARQMFDTAGLISVDYSNRLLIDTAGANQASWSTTGFTVDNALLINGSTSGTFTQKAAATTTSYSVFWPGAQAASSGYLLSNDGAGNLSWAAPAVTGANTALSNLTTTSINQSLNPASTNSFQNGNAANIWSTVGAQALYCANIIAANGYSSVEFQSPINMDAMKITGLANGTNPGDAVNYSQLTGIATGLTWQNAINDPDLLNDSLSSPPTPIYTFTITALSTITHAGDTYTNNSHTFTVVLLPQLEQQA